MSKSLYQPLRQGQLTVGSGWRAFFAPFNKVAALASSYSTIGPTMLDLNNMGPFNDANLPSHFVDLGLVTDLTVSNGSKLSGLRTGHRNLIRALYVGDLVETFSVKFDERSRIVDQISSGMQVFNLVSNPALAGLPTTAFGGPLSSTGALAVPLAASGYLASGTGATAGSPTLLVPAGSGALFPPGAYIVCDIDYIPGTAGYVGDAAALAAPGAVSDVDFIRKTSDYVARVVGFAPGLLAGQDGLVLNKPFQGGGNNIIAANATYAPSAAAKVQTVKGTVRRNGGSKINDWTCLLLLDTEDGSQFAIYYPHIVVSSPKGLASDTMPDATGLHKYSADTEFQALAFDDPIDGESVLSYMAYYPNKGQDIQA